MLRGLYLSARSMFFCRANPLIKLWSRSQIRSRHYATVVRLASARKPYSEPMLTGRYTVLRNLLFRQTEEGPVGAALRYDCTGNVTDTCCLATEIRHVMSHCSSCPPKGQ